MTVDRAKQSQPNAYLFKPFNKDELYTSIEIAIFNHNSLKTNEKQNNDSLFIKHKQIFLKIKFDDILFLKSDHIYVEIYTIQDEKYLIRGSLNEYSELANNQFVRVHRRFIVNTKYVKSIENETLNVNDIEIPIAKVFKKDLMDKMNIL